MPRRRVGQAARELLVRHVGLGVAGAARRPGDRRVVEDVGVAPADAAEHRQARADLDVHLAAGLRRAVGELLQDLQIVRGAGVGRRRQIVQHLARERGHRDRRAGRIHLAGQRIAHIDGQDAAALRHRRDRRARRLAARLIEDLDVGEEERLVLHDRAAEHAAELIAIEAGLHAGRGPEEAGGVELGAAHELPRRAAEGVGAARIGDVDRRAGRASVLGAHVVGDDLELADRVRRRLHHLVREALVAGAVGVVVDAVDQEVVEGRAQAVDVERAFARREAAGVERRQRARPATAAPAPSTRGR